MAGKMVLYFLASLGVISITGLVIFMFSIIIFEIEEMIKKRGKKDGI